MILSVLEGRFPIASLFKCDISYLWCLVWVPMHLESFLFRYASGQPDNLTTDGNIPCHGDEEVDVCITILCTPSTSGEIVISEYMDN